jgi:glycosyltransferase involved in cell wall biosynthesis
VGLIFGLQVADTKGRGGIVTAVRHYARMFDAVGVSSACLYRGPATDMLRAEGIDVMAAPRSLKHLWGRVLPHEIAAGREIRARAAGRAILAVVHSDLALPAIRHMLPNAVVVTPCHSDKADRKRHADLVVTLNPVQHKLVSTTLAGSRPRVAMLGNPFVSRRASPAPRPDGPIRINFCGRFTDIKNPLLLMRAAALLNTRPLPELRFIGEGPLEGALREAAEQLARQVSMRATFTGWIPDPLDDFHRGDVLAVTSTWEGAPYLLQEALDADIPVISSDNQGSQYVLSGGAYGALYPPDDAAALARAIDAAIADPEALRSRTILGRTELHARHGAVPFWEALRGALQTVAARHRGDGETAAQLWAT